MNKQLERQTLTIFDEVYTLVSDESKERLLRAAQTLNERMKLLGVVGDDKKRAVVLCSLQVALDYERLKEEVCQAKHKENSLAALIDDTLIASPSS